jgi:hypothetical protein
MAGREQEHLPGTCQGHLALPKLLSVLGLVLSASCTFCLLRVLTTTHSTYAGCRWLTPVILATQEAEIRRITVRSQPGKIVLRDTILKEPFTKKGWWSALGYRP